MEPDKEKKIIIIGAGVAGMAAALKLLENGFNCTLLEMEKEPGGLTRSFKIGNKNFPLGYHHVLAKDKPLLDMLKKLNLHTDLTWKKIKVMFAIDDKTYNLENPLDLLRFPLPWLDKLKFLRFIFYCFVKKNWDVDMGDAEQWIDKIAGKRVRKMIFEPLSDIKYGLPAKSLSANWLGSRLHYKEFSKPLGYIRHVDWSKIFIDEMVKKIEKGGGTIITDAKVFQINTKSENFRSVIYLRDEKKIEMAGDILINTAPPHIFLTMLKYPDQNLKKIEYLDALSLIAEIEEKLPRDFYLLSCLKPRHALGGIYALSSLNQTIGIQEKTVINFFTTLGPPYEYLRDKNAEELFKIYSDDFQKIFNFRPTPVWYRLNLIKNYSPKFLNNFTNPDYRSSVPGIFFAGNYLTYPLITSTGSAIASGEKTANYIIKNYGR